MDNQRGPNKPRVTKHQLSRTVSRYPKLTLPSIQAARVPQNPIPNPLNYSLSPQHTLFACAQMAGRFVRASKYRECLAHALQLSLLLMRSL